MSNVSPSNEYPWMVAYSMSCFVFETLFTANTLQHSPHCLHSTIGFKEHRDVLGTAAQF
jgi:hypothetical protein